VGSAAIVWEGDPLRPLRGHLPEGRGGVALRGSGSDRPPRGAVRAADWGGPAQEWHGDGAGERLERGRVALREEQVRRYGGQGLGGGAREKGGPQEANDSTGMANRECALLLSSEDGKRLVTLRASGAVCNRREAGQVRG